MLIAVDHGNSFIKTPKQHFCSGIAEYPVRPPADDLIEFEGSFWALTNDRISFMRNKTADNRFFVLTLFAVVKELTLLKALKPLNEIDLAVGLPPEHIGNLRDAFEQYFKRGAQISFVYNGTPLTILIRRVFVYPQAYAAVAPQIAQLMKVKRTFIVDIGGITTDVLLLNEGRPDPQMCRSLEVGIIALQNTLIGKVNAKHDMTIEADHVDMVLQGQETILPEEVRHTIREAAQQHADFLLEKLREMKVDLRTTPAIFIGGGSILLREYLETSPMVTKPEFVLESNANAVGYQMLAEAQLRRVELEGT